MTKSIDLCTVSSWIFDFRDWVLLYADDGWYAMETEQTVAPQDAGNLGRVQSPRERRHERLRKIWHVGLSHAFVRSEGRGFELARLERNRPARHRHRLTRADRYYGLTHQRMSLSGIQPFNKLAAWAVKQLTTSPPASPKAGAAFRITTHDSPVILQPRCRRAPSITSPLCPLSFASKFGKLRSLSHLFGLRFASPLQVMVSTRTRARLR